jgi:hypothetical protein
MGRKLLNRHIELGQIFILTNPLGMGLPSSHLFAYELHIHQNNLVDKGKFSHHTYL